MKAALLYGASDVRIEEVGRPEPAPGEVLIRVRAVTICPSDWRMYVDGHSGGVVPERPIIQGHEFTGDVVSIGDGVTEPAIGSRVAVEPSWPCGECDMCCMGRGNICRRIRFPSFPPVDGALAEYIACPASATLPLPHGLSYEQGALTEPLGVSLHAVRLAKLRPDESVCILGAGLIGMGVLALSARKGPAPVAVVEPVAERRRWPAEHGASRLAASHHELLDEGYEADVVFECSGDSEALDQAVRLARPGGRVVVIGIPRDERITFDMSIARRHELTFLFSRRSHNTLGESIELLARGEVDFRGIPMARFPLERTEEALKLAGSPGPILRAVVLP